MPGPPDGSCTRTREQKLLIHGSVRDGAVHVASTSHLGQRGRSTHTARTKYARFLGEENGVIQIKAAQTVRTGIAAAGSNK